MVLLQLTNSYLKNIIKFGCLPISLKKKEEVISKITTDYYD